MLQNRLTNTPYEVTISLRVVVEVAVVGVDNVGVRGVVWSSSRRPVVAGIHFIPLLMRLSEYLAAPKRGKIIWPYILSA